MVIVKQPKSSLLLLLNILNKIKITCDFPSDSMKVLDLPVHLCVERNVSIRPTRLTCAPVCRDRWVDQTHTTYLCVGGDQVDETEEWNGWKEEYEEHEISEQVE